MKAIEIRESLQQVELRKVTTLKLVFAVHSMLQRKIYERKAFKEAKHTGAIIQSLVLC